MNRTSSARTAPAIDTFSAPAATRRVSQATLGPRVKRLMAVFQRTDHQDRLAANREQTLQKVRRALGALAEPGSDVSQWLSCVLALSHLDSIRFNDDAQQFSQFEQLVAEAAEDKSAEQIQMVMLHLRGARRHIDAELALRSSDIDFADTIRYINSTNYQLNRILQTRPDTQAIVDVVKASNKPDVIAHYATPARLAGRIGGRIAQAVPGLERIPPADPELSSRPMATLVSQYQAVMKGSFDSGNREGALRTELVNRRLFPQMLTATVAALPFIAAASENSFNFKYRNWVDEMSELGRAHGHHGAGWALGCDALATCAFSDQHRAGVERLFDRLSNDDLGAIMISAPGGLANQEERDLLFRLADERMFGRREAAMQGFVDAAATVEKRLAYSQTRHSSRLADALIALVAHDAAVADWSLDDSPSGPQVEEARERLHRKLGGLGENAFSGLEPLKREALVAASRAMGFADIAALAT